LIDAQTFETEQIVRIPDPTISSLPISGGLGHRSTRSESAISNIPTINSVGLPALTVDRPLSSDEEVDDDGVVVVPRLGSSGEEKDVSKLLRRHGLRTARTRLKPTRRWSESQQGRDEDIGRARRQETLIEESLRAGETLDLTGVCFDPTGSHVYVGSSKGIVEYRRRGAEKT
jgi:hypothetical protein